MSCLQTRSMPVRGMQQGMCTGFGWGLGNLLAPRSSSLVPTSQRIKTSSSFYDSVHTLGQGLSLKAHQHKTDLFICARLRRLPGAMDSQEVKVKIESGTPPPPDWDSLAGATTSEKIKTAVSSNAVLVVSYQAPVQACLSCCINIVLELLKILSSALSSCFDPLRCCCPRFAVRQVLVGCAKQWRCAARPRGRPAGG